jgi:hypothetical protein
MSTASRRAHQPNQIPDSQTPRAMATAIAAATAQGNTSLSMCRSGRCERVGGTGAAAWPRPELRLGDPEMAVLSSANKLPAAATHCEAEQK